MLLLLVLAQVQGSAEDERVQISLWE